VGKSNVELRFLISDLAVLASAIRNPHAIANQMAHPLPQVVLTGVKSDGPPATAGGSDRSQRARDYFPPVGLTL
jgi:hypothetical protein